MKSRTPNYKRPSHPDFMDSAELKAIEFSGIRVNQLSRSVEIWTLGDCRAFVTAEEMLRDPDAVDKAYKEVFAFHEHQTLQEK